MGGKNWFKKISTLPTELLIRIKTIDLFNYPFLLRKFNKNDKRCVQDFEKLHDSTVMTPSSPRPVFALRPSAKLLRGVRR